MPQQGDQARKPCCSREIRLESHAAAGTQKAGTQDRKLGLHLSTVLLQVWAPGREAVAWPGGLEHPSPPLVSAVRPEDIQAFLPAAESSHKTLEVHPAVTQLSPLVTNPGLRPDFP